MLMLRKAETLGMFPTSMGFTGIIHLHTQVLQDSLSAMACLGPVGHHHPQVPPPLMGQ